MFSWKIEASAIAKTSKKEVWKYWSDATTWPEWDEGLQWCKIDGPFSKGTKGSLKPKGWMVTKFIFTNVEFEKGFTDLTKMPLTSVVFSHTLKEISDHEVEITHEVKVTGLLAPLLKLTMRKDLTKGIPQTVNRLAKLAEGKI